MATFERERTIAIAALLLLTVTCGLAVGVSLELRADAAADLAEAQDALSRLEARARPAAGGRDHAAPMAAPAAAFLDAATEGLAGAQLQAYLAQLARAQRAVLISSGVQPGPGGRTDAPDLIRVEATLSLTLKALQALLFELESGAPFVFVDALNVQPPSATAPAPGAQDMVLRVTISMHALWRRGSV